MARVKVEVGTDARGVGPGLARVEAQLDKFGSTVGKKFSLASIFKGAAQGLGLFGTFKLAETLAKPFEDAANSAREIAEQTERTTAAVKAGLVARNADSPERQKAALIKEQTDLGRQRSDQQVKTQVVSAESEAANAALETSGPLGRAIKNIKNLFYDAPLKFLAAKEVATLTTAMQEAGNQADSLQRQIDKRLESLSDEKSRIMDNRRVRRGEMTEMQAAYEELMRRQEAAQRVRERNGVGVASKDADLDVLRQQDAITELRRKAGTQGIVADSLARVGGGGAVFGGGDAQLSEAKTQTKILSSILQAVSKGSYTTFTFRN